MTTAKLESPSAEQLVLASVIEANGLLDDIASLIGSDDFTVPEYRAVWGAITDLKNLRRAFDAVQVAEHLLDRGQADAESIVGGIISGGHSGRSAAVSHAKRIREYTVLRNLIDASGRITDLVESHAGRNVNELLSEADGILSGVISGNLGNDLPLIDGVALMRQVYDDATRAAGNPGISGISTGLPSLDDKIDGLQPANMIVVAAPPSMGKTTFAMALVQHAMKRTKYPAVVFSMEMPALDIGRRMVSSESRVHYAAIKRGSMTDEQASIMATAASRLQTKNLIVCDASGLTPARMRGVLRRVVREHGGVSMAVVDYIQLMDANKANANNRNLELTGISRDIKRMAMDFNMPFIAISQLTKDVEKAKRKPTNGDLRESGAIAQDADLVMMVHRQEKYDDEPNQENMGKAEILITKNRNGACGSVLVGYDGPTFRFHELGPESW